MPEHLEKMTAEEYRETQQLMLTWSEMITLLNLDGFLQRIDECEALAPLLDPTLYLRGGTTLNKIKRVAQTAMELKEAMLELQGK